MSTATMPFWTPPGKAAPLVEDYDALDDHIRREAAASAQAHRDRDAATNTILELLRRWKPRAYHCDETDPDTWHADCPECITPRVLLVRQYGSRVELRCTGRHGCDEQTILARLQAAANRTDPWAVAAQWEAIALRGQAIAYDLADQLARALAA